MSLPSPPLPSPLLSLSLLPLPIILILTAQTLTQYFPRPPHSKFSFEIKRNHFANISLPRPQLALSSALCVDSRVWMKIYLQPESLTWRANWSCDSGIAILHRVYTTVHSSPPLVKHPADQTCKSGHNPPQLANTEREKLFWRSQTR